MEFPQEYWEILEKGTEFICALSNNDNVIVNIGDSDDGKTIVLSESEPNQVQSLLATSAVLFKKSDFKVKASFFDEMSLWLLGNTGKSEFEALDINSQPSCPAKFEDGGYYVLESDGPSRTKVVFDCGPLGFGPIAGHGHADSLSFILYAYECEFFIDPGTYTFEAENPYRYYFKSTAAHNTITIDRKDQSEMEGPFLWGKKATSTLEEWSDSEEYFRVTGSHDGFRRLDDPVLHRRTVELDKKGGRLNIKDYIEAKSSHEICQYFHLAPECEITELKKNHWRIKNGPAAIELVIDEQFMCEVVKGGDEPICGWASCSYGSKVPTNTFACRLSSKRNQRFLTRIML